MTMKRYTILSLLMAVSLTSALACGPKSRPHYYVFSVFNRLQMGEQFDARVLQFWEQYTGKELDFWDVQSLASLNLDNPAHEAGNPIYKKAVSKNDKETQAYLLLLNRYFQCSKVFKPDEWDYPSQEELAQANGEMSIVQSLAQRYKGKRYQAQYALLAMRAMMTKGQWEEAAAYWKSTGSRMPNSVFRDMMEDIYAGALLRNGRQQEACRIYADLGDMRSIKWCMRDQRNLAGIKKAYAKDPNSPTLIYLIQDFVNNAQETMDVDNPEMMKYVEATSIYDTEIKQFINFALQVVKDGQSNVPALWQSAAGFLHHFMGNNDEAVELLSEATRMKGTPRMKDNARACLLLARIAKVQSPSEFSSFLPAGIQWLFDIDRTEKKMNPTGGNHYTEVLERITYDNLVPMFQRWNRPEVTMNLLSMVGKLKNDGETPAYREGLDSLTAEEAITYNRYLHSTPSDPFEAWLLNNVSSTMNADRMNDQIGTKYMREGQWAKAVPYLEKVSLRYLSTLGISRYMSRRTYKADRWLKRQVVDRMSDYNWNATAPVATNQKLDYCRDLMALLSHAENATGEEQVSDNYKIGSMLLQASFKGDCWYLTRYRWSLYDTMCYKDEYDFVGNAINYLRQAERATNSMRTREKALYALAFIPRGWEFDLFNTDARGNYPAVPNGVNRQSPYYDDMLRLSQFYRDNRGNILPFVSHCDVLMTFCRLTAQQTGNTRKRPRR